MGLTSNSLKHRKLRAPRCLLRSRRSSCCGRRSTRRRPPSPFWPSCSTGITATSSCALLIFFKSIIFSQHSFDLICILSPMPFLFLIRRFKVPRPLVSKLLSPFISEGTYCFHALFVRSLLSDILPKLLVHLCRMVIAWIAIVSAQSPQPIAANLLQ